MPTLTEEERAELAARSSLIAMYRRTADLLTSEQNLYLRHVLESKGLDPSAKYELDQKTGEITPIEAEQKD